MMKLDEDSCKKVNIFPEKGNESSIYVPKYKTIQVKIREKGNNFSGER